jgi:acyl carrier protein
MTASVDDRLRSVFADVFETRPELISKDMSADNTGSWDSMQSIILASSVEAEFGIELTDEELVSLDSYPKILAAVKTRNPSEN